MKKLLCTALIGMVIMSGGCGKYESTYQQGMRSKRELEEQASTNTTMEQAEDKIEETLEEQEDEKVEEPSMDEYLSTLSGKYIYQDSEMSSEDLSQNTSVTYSEEDRTIEIDIKLTYLNPDIDVYGYIKALIDGQYPDTMQDMCDIAIQEVNEASDVAYELGFKETPAHLSCTILIEGVPIAGAFQGIKDDQPTIYYRIDQDK